MGVRVLEASLKRLSRQCPLPNDGWTELGDQHHRTRGDWNAVVKHVVAPIIPADPCTVGSQRILAHATRKVQQIDVDVIRPTK
jgi:hypothetical protein